MREDPFVAPNELKTLRDEFSYFWLQIRRIRAVKRIIFMGLIYVVGRVCWVKLSPMRIAERDRTVLWDPRPIYSRMVMWKWYLQIASSS